MPSIDEEVLGDLMHRATSDLHSAPGAADLVLTSRRRTARTRALTASVAGVAAVTAVAVGVATAGSGTASSGTHSTVASPGTSAHRTLLHLSLLAAVSKAPAGRYVVLSELQSQNDLRTTIIDSQTGTAWTFQKGAGIPDTLPADRGGPTSATFAGYPTSLRGLRRLLVAQYKHDLSVGIKAELPGLRKKEGSHFAEAKRQLIAGIPKETRDDMVFSQAAEMLWNPLVPPSLRSALFKVLAATPNVVVSKNARDSHGRAAIEISRRIKAAHLTQEVFEKPDASMVYETSSVVSPRPAQGGLPAAPGYTLSDTYLSVRWTNTRPTQDPYKQ